MLVGAVHGLSGLYVLLSLAMWLSWARWFMLGCAILFKFRDMHSEDQNTLAQPCGPAAPAMSLAAPTEYLSCIVGIGVLRELEKVWGIHERLPARLLGWLRGATPGRLPRICHMVFYLS